MLQVHLTHNTWDPVEYNQREIITLLEPVGFNQIYSMGDDFVARKC
jgi:hypothetical protein